MIREKISGAFDLLFLFGRGIDKFSGTKNEALQSAIIWAAVSCVMLALCPFYPPKGLETGLGMGQVLLTVAAQMVVSFILSNALVFVVAKALKREDKFWLFFSASNWTGGAASVVVVPLLLVGISGIIARVEMDRILALAACYLYVVTACIAWRAFRLPWQLAGLIAIVTLFAGEQTWSMLFALQGIPEPW